MELLKIHSTIEVLWYYWCSVFIHSDRYCTCIYLKVHCIGCLIWPKSLWQRTAINLY